MKTIQYYNDNAHAFYERTINLNLFPNLLHCYEVFSKYLPPRAHILDAGCGVGRDAKYFLSKGHDVTAFDASEKMVELASKEMGLTVLHSTFQEINFDSLFDAVWAQASLLHVPYHETKSVYEKIHRSLKPGGIFYASYKYGDDFRPLEDRDFYHMNEEIITPYFKGLFDIVEIWQERDDRHQAAPMPEKIWLNFIVRKRG